MPNITLNSDQNKSDQAQIGDVIYNTNLWNLNTVGDYTEQGFVQWMVAAGNQVFGDCYELPVEGSTDDTGMCNVCYRIDPDVNHSDGQGLDGANGTTNHVHAYPNMLFGSLGGRWETWGRICNTTQSLSGSNQYRCFSPVFDMRTPNANIGLPERLDQIGTVGFCFDMKVDCSGDAANIENGFVDTYLHRIDNPNLWPDNFDPAWGDLNKINENATETWNINFKVCLPEGLNANQATGGPALNSTPITIDGRDWEIHVKLEGTGPRDNITGLVNNDPTRKCANSFYYISFVPWGADGNGPFRGYCDVTNFCVNYKAFLDYVASQEFKDRVLGQNGQPQVAYNGQAHFPSWIYDQVGQPPFPVDSPQSYVLDGIGIGNEIWYSPNSQESCICWGNVTFTTDRGTFGKNTQRVGDCVKTSCTALVGDGACDCAGVPPTASGTCGVPLSIGYSLPSNASITGASTTLPNATITTFTPTGLTMTSLGCTSAMTGTINIQYTRLGVPCQCSIAVTLQPDGPCTTSNPVLVNCPTTLQANQPATVSVTGCCPGATIQWTADSANVVFGSPNAATTTVTSVVDGTYTITATCCDP